MPKIEFELLKVWENSGRTSDLYTVKIGEDLWEMSDDPMSPGDPLSIVERWKKESFILTGGENRFL
jgi:hypothetical protein